jgi:hypothetical protein
MKKLVQLLAFFLVSVTAFAQTARVQVIHNSADDAAAVVDVYVGETLAIPNFEFRTASPFVDLPAEEEIKLAIAPENSNSVEDAIYSATVTLTDGETYIVVADGIVVTSNYNPAPQFGLEIYPIGREAASNPANVDVLVHHGSTDAPTVDVIETGLGAGTIVDDLAYTDFQGYLELPTADYVLEIRDETGSVGVAAFGAPLETLALDGAALVVVASGFLNPSQNNNGAAFGLWAASPLGGPLLELPSAPLVQQTARVQVIHNCADDAATVVDVYVDADLAAPDFAFRTATPFVDLPAGVEIELSVAPENSSSVDDAIYTVPVTLMEGETYIVVADGIVDPTNYDPAPAFGLEVYPMGREAASDPANVDVLVHHGSTDAPTVDVVETGQGAGTIVDDLAYTDFQGYLELPTADYVLEIRDETGSVGVAAFGAPLETLALDGAALVVVASGFLDPSQNNDGPAFGLWVASPAGGAMLELPSAPLGIEDNALNTFALYPNPANSVINLRVDGVDLSEYTVSISDMLGRLVYNSKLSSNNNAINIGSFSEGVYNMTISNGTQNTITKRFIKN